MVGLTGRFLGRPRPGGPGPFHPWSGDTAYCRGNIRDSGYQALSLKGQAGAFSPPRQTAMIRWPHKPQLLHDGSTNTIFGGYGELDGMIGLIQRVNNASVVVAEEPVGEIGRGLLVLVAVQPDDTPERAARMAERLLTYRVFPDAAGRMNESLLDQGLELLLVPQFTLAADTRKGTRASFTRAAAPDVGREYFELLLQRCRDQLPRTASGKFGADMQVALVNDGPVTFWLET